MKKLFTCIVLLSLVMLNAGAQEEMSRNKRLKSGFWLKMGYNATPSSFLHEGTGSYNEKAADFGFNFQLGTTFYIGPRIGNMLRFGVDASWIDLNYFKLNDDVFSKGSNVYFNFLEVGPKISFSPVKAIAFDMYGRVVPSLSWLYWEGNSFGETTDENYFGYRTNGLIGFAFRAGVFETAVEYKLGKMEYTNVDDDTDVRSKVNVQNIRLLIGFKF